MRKISLICVLVLVAAMSLSACADKEADATESPPAVAEEVSPSPKPASPTDMRPMPSINIPESVGPQQSSNPMDIGMMELPSYTYEQLFEYYSHSDGAYATAAFIEMRTRFAADPHEFLSAVTRADADLQERIAYGLGRDMNLWSDIEDYKAVLDSAGELDLSDAEREVLNRIVEAYEKPPV
jgi:hypothetical protein